MARILVVDPDESRRRATVRRLSGEGHVVSWCASPGAAARARAEHAFDAIAFGSPALDEPPARRRPRR